jgi:hypothetical protein
MTTSAAPGWRALHSHILVEVLLSNANVLNGIADCTVKAAYASSLVAAKPSELVCSCARDVDSDYC